jgi:crotonobetainyl-CoA:carnitine CoA-transferase CaiB-like acyl-CoA transferase
MGVGSMATRLLGDFGAEVIKIENRRRLDRPRRLPIYKGGAGRSYGEEDANPDPEKSGLHNNYSRNKLGVTIDMSDPRGRQLAERLIGVSSVVTENFAPSVMERWGLTYPRLRELTPDVIFARMSGYGHSGPDHHYRSYGPVVQAVSGLSFISGLPGREPSGWGLSYMDNQAAYYSSIGLLMSIFNRMRTGRGGEIDVAAVEAGIGLLGPVMLDVTVNGRATRTGAFPTGNRLESPEAAPHGVYPSLGEDRWVAIAVFDDDEWRRLAKALGDPVWAADERFATPHGRFTHQDELDTHLTEWTRTRDNHEVMHLLQSHGVRAAAAQNAQDVNEVDEQLAHRGLFFELDHPVIGPARFEGVPIRMSTTQADNWRSAPLLGEDNEYVFRGLVGLDAEEYDDLVQAGVI